MIEPEDRVQEEVGGSKRLQTKRPNSADRARIVVTLHITSTHDQRKRELPSWQSDRTISLARQYIERYEQGRLSLSDLVALADSVEVNAAG